MIVCALVCSHVGALAQNGVPPEPPDDPVEQSMSIPTDASKIETLVEIVPDAEIEATAAAAVETVMSDAPLSEIADHRYQMIIPTEQPNHLADKSGVFAPEFRSRRLSDFGNMLNILNDKKLLPTWEKRKPVIVIYLPSREYYETNRDEIAQRALEEFQNAQPNIEPEIRFRVINTNINHVFYHAILKNLLRSAAREGNAAERAEAAELSKINDEVYKQTKNRFDITAPLSDRYRVGGAFVRAGLLFGIRTVQFLPAYHLGTVPSLIAFSASLFDSGVELYTALFSRKMQMKLADVSYLAKKNADGTRGPINPKLKLAVSILQSSVANTALFVTIRSSVMQAAQAFAMPGVAGPTLGGAAWSSFINFPGGFFNAAFVNGYNRLIEKGWLTVAQVNMSLLGISALDMAVNISNSTASLGWVRLVALPIIWLTYSAVFGVSFIAPKRADKILLIHKDVPWGNIDNEQGSTKSTFWVDHDTHDADLANAFEAMQAARRRHNLCDWNLGGPVPPATNPTAH